MGEILKNFNRLCDTLKSDSFNVRKNIFPHDVKMRIIKYYPNTKGIEHHYCQSGGNIPIFVGSPLQRCSGLGQILSGLFKQALPILKKKYYQQLSDVIINKKGVKQPLLDTGKNRISEFVGNTLVTGRSKKRKKSSPQTSVKRRKLNLVL